MFTAFDRSADMRFASLGRKFGLFGTFAFDALEPCETSLGPAEPCYAVCHRDGATAET